MSTHNVINEDRKLAPVYMLWEGEMILDAPIEDAWRCAIDYPAWQNYSIVRNVSGEVGKEGEVVFLQKQERGFTFPPYYARTIKIELNRRIIWKTFIDKGAHEIDRFGIVEFRLESVGAQTRFRNSLLYEFMVPYRTEQDLAAFREDQDRNFKALLSTTYPKLQELVRERVSKCL